MHTRKMSQLNHRELTAEGVSFDGVSDRLYRNSDLIGNTDSTQFTFSVFVYISAIPSPLPYIAQFNGARFVLYWSNSSTIRFQARDSSNTDAVVFTIPASNAALNTVNHILISVDTSSTAKRHVVINDVDVVPSWQAYVTGAVIDFTGTEHSIAASNTASNFLSGRIAHAFLAHEYLDTSVTANKRIFSDEYGLPTDDARSNWMAAGYADPIIYAPMRTPEAAHINEGTGGDFTASGVLDAAQVGLNQWQCVASEFDGADDYLSKPDIGATDGPRFTLRFIYNTADQGDMPFYINNGSQSSLIVYTINQTVQIAGYETPNGAIACNFKISNAHIIKPGTVNDIAVSIDLTDTSKRRVCLNGVDVTQDVIWTTYDTSKTINLASSSYDICKYNYWGGSIGELYFDTTYTDLSLENPFWDDGANKPKPVRKVLVDTGYTPKVAMPIRADNPGKNYGTSGDFTLYGGSLKGARGMSEFVSRSASAANTSSYLYLPVLPTLPDGKKFSFFGAYRGNGGENRLFSEGSSTNGLVVRSENQNDLQIYARNAANTVILSAQFTDVSTANDDEWRLVFVSIDMSNQAACYVATGSAGNTVFSTFTDDLIDFTKGQWQLLSHAFGYMEESAAYFVNDWVDFSNEEIRNMFVDQLGYPKDLSQAIDDGLIPRPVFYLKFDDPNDVGLDSSGSGNHFTAYGNITSGADYYV